MKRLLAAMLLAAVLIPSAAHAAFGPGVLHTDNLKWRRLIASASNGGVVDSTVFKSNGSSAATRDTSRWIDVSDMAPWGPALASAGDSSLAMFFEIHPIATDPYSGTTFGIGSDSLYAYIEGTNVDPSVTLGAANLRLLTNLTEIGPVAESNSDDSYNFKITWARWALQLAGVHWVRIIVRGDENGCWGGTFGYYTNANERMR